MITPHGNSGRLCPSDAEQGNKPAMKTRARIPARFLSAGPWSSQRRLSHSWKNAPFACPFNRQSLAGQLGRWPNIILFPLSNIPTPNGHPGKTRLGDRIEPFPDEAQRNF
jgi:hypothetical protein